MAVFSLINFDLSMYIFSVERRDGVIPPYLLHFRQMVWHIHHNITEYPVGCADLGAPHLTIGIRYPVGEHSVLPRSVKSNVFWANNVRPYGCTSANSLQRCAESAHPTVKQYHMV